MIVVFSLEAPDELMTRTKLIIVMDAVMDLFPYEQAKCNILKPVFIKGRFEGYEIVKKLE